jgi:putative peptidoglycan lipid II flippase
MKDMKPVLQRPLVHDTIVTTVLMTIGKSAGMTIPFFIAAWFGAGTRIDAFFLAYSIIIFFASIFGSTVSIVIVPYIVELHKLKKDIGQFTSSLLIISSIFYAFFLFTGSFVIQILLGIVTDLGPAAVDRVTLIILEMIPFVILLVWTNTLDGVFNAFKKFKIPAISPFLRAVIIICCIFLLKGVAGIHSIIAGYIAGEFLRLLFLVYVIKRKNIFHFSITISMSKNFIDFIKKGLYQTIAMVLVGINPLIDKIMASSQGEGSISILYYANRLYTIPVAFLVSGFLVTLLSYMSNHLYMENKTRFKNLVHKAGKTAGIFSFIIMVLGIFLYKPVIEFIFSFSSLKTTEIVQIQDVFFGYFIGFLPFIISQVYGYALVALRKTKALMFWAVCISVLNVALNYILMQFFHLMGLSLSTSIIRFINCVFFMGIFYYYFSKQR